MIQWWCFVCYLGAYPQNSVSNTLSCVTALLLEGELLKLFLVIGETGGGGSLGFLSYQDLVSRKMVA